jgi:hypothetical protein
MRRLLFALSFCFATIGYADPFQVNLQDKKESYQLGVETKLGTVHVASSFVGDPLVSPVTITVSISCSRTGRTRVVAKLDAFDYGSSRDRTKLSQFDPAKQILTVFYVSGVVDESGRVQFEKDRTHSYQLSSACN